MPTPTISAPLLRWFRVIVRRYFRRQFHGVRISGQQQACGIKGPLIVYANHSSWWDPMVSFLLADLLFPERQHYAPMEAAALRRYRILGRLGIFPVETDSPRGAVQFLRTGEAILAAGGVLWVTPQGRFADARERPLRFKPGLSALATRAAAHLGTCTVLPLAIEYTFWDERLPECLLRLGAPIRVTPATGAGELDAELRAALGDEMDALTAMALQRSPLMVDGSAGAGGFYALGKRVKAFLTRRLYVPEHTPAPRAAVLPPVLTNPQPEPVPATTHEGL
ncbi:MAG: lysophospholipid acyltransferase family protein [Acidobacteriaceae bacterium]